MDDELEGMRKNSALSYFNAIFCQAPVGNEENHETLRITGLQVGGRAAGLCNFYKDILSCKLQRTYLNDPNISHISGVRTAKISIILGEEQKSVLFWLLQTPC